MPQLSELKVGDRVTLFRRSIFQIAKIERITPKGYIGVGTYLFDPRSGIQRGATGYNVLYIEPTTDEHVYMLRKAQLVGRLRTVDFSNYPVDKLEAVYKILLQEKKQDDTNPESTV